MNLFLEYFYYNNSNRDSEIIESLIKNSEFSFIDNIYCFAPKLTLEHLQHKNIKKIMCVDMEARCTFQDLFEYANSVSTGGISCISNSDIIFSQDFANMNITTKDFYCISRREYNKSFSTNVGKWSQDVWCWLGQTTIKNCNFYFGVPGNDNTIPYHANEAGYNVKNPSLTYKCYHNHKSNYRIYKMEDRLDRAFYKEVIPCYA